MARLIFIISIIFLLNTQSSAFSFKKYAGEFFHLGVGSRALAMAGAYTAVANDVTAGYWNPAGLTEAKGFQLQFMHSKQFSASIQHNYLAVSNPMDENSVIGVSLLYLTVNGIKDSRDAYDFEEQKVDPSKIKRFNTGDYTFLISYSRAHNKSLSYGLNVKAIYRDYHVESALGLGFDAGLKYYLSDSFALGLMLNDITTTTMVWSTGEKEMVTPSMRLGLSYLFTIPAFKLSLQPAADFNILFENRDFASQLKLGPVSLDSFFGIEIAYDGVLALRAGMDDLNRFNTGIGMSIPKITFDYSFTAYQSELGDIHRISFHVQLDRLF